MSESMSAPEIAVSTGMDRNWPVVAAAGVGLVFSVATLLINTSGVFIQPLMTEFGWTRTQIAIAIGIVNYSFGLGLPFCGLMIDRFGPRLVLIPSTIVLGVMVGSLSLLTAYLWHLYLIFALAAFLGVAASPIGYSTVLVRQFDRRLGLALGLALMGVGLGGAILPPLTQALISNWGWREAYATLGALTMVVGLPAAVFVTRGVPRPVLRTSGEARTSMLPMLRTHAFALLAVIFFLLGILSVGTLANLVPIMISRGFTPQGAAQIAGVTGIAALVGRGCVGWVLDRIHGPYVVAAATALILIAFMLLAFSDGIAASYAIAALTGSLLGAEGDFIPFLLRRYFGDVVFGRLYGVLFIVFVVGTGSGPIMASLSADYLGGFRPVGLLFGGVAFVVMLLTLAMPSYRESRSQELRASES